MVFKDLGTNEKDAFFSLLDEYFTSRPEIFNAAATQGGSSAGNSNPFRKEITGAQAQAATAAISRAGTGAAKFVSAGFKSLKSPNPSNSGSGGGSAPPVAGQQHGQPETMDIQSVGSLADRIAALQAAKQHDTGGSSGSASNAKKFGDVDTSSLKNAYGSMKSSFSNPTKTAQSPPSRFTPPVARAIVPPQPEPEQEPEPEPEQQGDWAEALYDYESAESGDLELKEGQRVLVIERSSGDWWTGEINGMQGLFPASYVKLL